MFARHELPPANDIQKLYNQLCDLVNEIIGLIITKPSWAIQVVAYISAVIYFAVTTYQDLVENGESTEYAVARGAGAALKNVLVPTIFFPVSRMALTRIASIPVIDKFFISSEDRVDSHKLIGAGISIAAGLHTVAHLKNNPSILLTQPGMTGLMMLGSIAIPISGMYLFSQYIRIGNMSYGLKVLGTHRIGASIFLAAYACHTTDRRLMLPAVVSVGGHLADYFIQNIFYTYRSQVSSVNLLSDGDMLSLKLKTPNGFQFMPGQYARLTVPPIDTLFEYPHPLTIVNNQHDELEFIIKKAGPWTTRLFNWVEYASKNNIPTPVTISGPFGNSLTSCDMNKPLTFIATGIGITPLIAYLYYLHVTHAQSPEINMHISHRSLAGFMPLLAPLADVVNDGKIQSAHFYLTGNQEAEKNSHVRLNEIVAAYPALRFFAAERKSERNAGNHDAMPDKHVIDSTWERSGMGLFSGIEVHFKRPNLRDIIAGKRHTIAVCGNPALTREVKKISSECEIRCYKEAFN